jgi:hypothetical protein
LRNELDSGVTPRSANVSVSGALQSRQLPMI